MSWLPWTLAALAAGGWAVALYWWRQALDWKLAAGRTFDALVDAEVEAACDRMRRP